ncbi:MAG: HAD hydrolase-like protein [Deltaproteobacteria bacterium]|nr:HAD hydrolase-like protein [Deltaproteobacteria bacterium]
MQARAVLFDLDGTLLDTLGDLAASTNAVLEALGLPQHPDAAYKDFVGEGLEQLVRRALPEEHADDATVAEGLRRLREHYGAHLLDLTRPYPGIPELLDALVARGLPMVVLSNKAEDFTVRLAEALLSRWPFVHVWGSVPERKKKPDPGAALALATELEVAPSTVVYLGDTGIDMRTARGAGMRAVGVLWGFRGPEELLAAGAEALIARPEELLALLR